MYAHQTELDVDVDAMDMECETEPIESPLEEEVGIEADYDWIRSGC